MRWHVVALGIALFVASTCVSHAGVWAWGCQGQLDAPAQTVIFNRYSMVVLDGKRPALKQEDLRSDRTLDNLIKDGAAGYNPDNVNSGFEEKTIAFAREQEPKGKVTLTEQSSRRLSHKARLICGRDEIIDTFRKVYRYERDSEKPRTVTMTCSEYTLSTRGGRPCN